MCSGETWKIARCCGAKRMFKLKCTKHTTFGPLFGSCDVKKWHAAVAGSAFATQNVKKLTAAGRGPLFEVGMWKMGTPLWREARFKVKMYKTHQFWKFRCQKVARRCGAKHISKSKCKNMRCSATFWSSDDTKWHAAVAPNAFTRRNVKDTCVLHHFWRLRCRKGVRQKR